MSEPHRPTLSLILCSRNDDYMGNSRWRLQTALNCLSGTLEKLNRVDDVEVVVTDWGSEAPLRAALALSPTAMRITTFVYVPKATTADLQRDSPFSEVIALNAAARRARGTYIGRIDQDTIVGQQFLASFFTLVAGTSDLGIGFSNTKYINYRFAVRCPPIESVEWYIRCFGRAIKRENHRSTAPIYESAVGIWLAHRSVWDTCGGYDERMIYMNGMEANMVRRLLPSHAMIDLGAVCDYDFYHLEHYHPWTVRKSSTYRRVNPHLPFAEPKVLNPNGPAWGLGEYNLDSSPASSCAIETRRFKVVLSFLRFALLLLRVLPTMMADTVGLSIRRFWHCSRRLIEFVWPHPATAWPGILLARWKARRHIT